MNTAFIFGAGVLCFGLTLVGVILTIYEFRKISRVSASPVAPESRAPLAVDFTASRSSAS